MKIVADDKIPFIRGVFEPHSEVIYLPGGEIRREHLVDADCLVVRTRTHCDRQLLEGTPVRFIGTATIGFDHIDTGWCQKNGIAWSNAPGCNSGAVAQYVLAAMRVMSEKNGFSLSSKTLGIIGVGHVGKKVEKIARDLGMQVILNDPPREKVEGPSKFSALPDLLKKADIITIHVPLDREGPYRTIGLIGREFLEQVRPGAILINSSRGEVLDEDDFLEWDKSKQTGSVQDRHRLNLVLDVWPHEPELNRKLLSRTSIGTPHIAGYSVEGKYNATKIIVHEITRHFQLMESHFPPLLKDGRKVEQSGTMADYDIMADDEQLRKSPETFEKQRNNYKQRWEFLSLQDSGTFC